MEGIFIKTPKIIAVKKKEPVSYELLAKNLYFYTQQRLELEKKEKAAKKQLDAYIDENMKPDDKGNRFFRFTYDDTPMIVTRQARTSVSVSIEKIKETFASDVISAVVKEKLVEYLDEEALEKLVMDEIITMEELESVTDKKIVYATVTGKEKTEEAEDLGEDVSQT